MGTYGASKFALEALSDVLRLELSPRNVSVSVVQPGTILNTNIRSKGRKKQTEPDAADASASPVASPYDQFYESARRRLKAADDAGVGDSPAIVADAVLHALTSATPQPRYIVGRVGPLSAIVVRSLCCVLPTRLIDAILLKVMLK